MKRLLFAMCGLAACGPATTTTTTTTTPPAGSDVPVATGGDQGAKQPPPLVDATPVRISACKGGSLMLGPAVDYPPPPGASGALGVGLLNPDAPLDLIVGGIDGQGTGTLGVMIGNGDGTFKPPVTYQLLPGAVPSSVALTDFDTDEDLDVVTAGGTGTPEVFLNNGDGTFGQPVALPQAAGIPVGGPHVVVRVADIHGDAHPDVVTYAGAGFDVWHDEGRAKFSASYLVPPSGLDGGAGLALADLDGNGHIDIAVAGIDNGKPSVVVMLGTKSGFPSVARYATSSTGAAAAIVTGDFNGDHVPDLAALFVDGHSGSIAVLLGTGKGTFGAATVLPVADATSSEAADALAAADLDGDGRTDLAVTTVDGLAVFHASGTAAGFDAPVTIPARDLRAVIAGDFTGAHLNGLAATRANGHAVVWPASCQ